jgi:GxxExxY protein
MLQEELTNKVIGIFYKVYNTLGYGFLEKVYERSMLIELRKSGLITENQKPITVNYENENVGDYFADIVVNDILNLELKAAESLCEEHEFQLINYLKATEMEVGLLFYFGKKPEFRRKIFTNDRKKIEHEQHESDESTRI